MRGSCVLRRFIGLRNIDRLRRFCRLPDIDRLRRFIRLRELIEVGSRTECRSVWSAASAACKFFALANKIYVVATSTAVFGDIAVFSDKLQLAAAGFTKFIHNISSAKNAIKRDCPAHIPKIKRLQVTSSGLLCK